MTPKSRWTLPNIITLVRIASCPAVFVLALSTTVTGRIAAFVLYLAAALSDVWDGYLARKHGWITDMGKLLDPLADKLLLLAAFIPFYLISRRPEPWEAVPLWGALPLWVLLVVFGREIAVTLLRSWASERGTVIAAGTSGKYKALFQSIFCASLLAWYPLAQLEVERGWDGGAWAAWAAFHQAVVGASLALAVILTVYSGVDYFWSYRSLARSGSARGGD